MGSALATLSVLLLAASPADRSAPSSGAAAPAGSALAARAGQLVGIPSLRAVTRKLPDDCTGLVRLVYDEAGVDLTSGVRSGGRAMNGVTAIYLGARHRRALRKSHPQPGDLVFFKETYDLNRDGRRNDGLTHVGLVETIGPDGTVTFIHRTSLGVTRSRMNLRHPKMLAAASGAVLNDYVRKAGHDRRGYLAGELFAGYASARRLLAPSEATHLARVSPPSSR